VPDNVPRAVSRSVQLRSNDCADVANSDLHCVGCCTLRLPTDVDGGPGETECNRGIDSGGGEKGADVGDAGLLPRISVAEKDAVADYGDCC
jgi:hypothetical protein